MSRILLIPGDGPEREFVLRAGDLISRLVPSLTVETAEFGRASWELTNEVLPLETEDSVMSAETIFCGRADVGGLGKKDPLETIVMYNDLFARMTQVVSLFKSQKYTNMSVTSPILSATRQIREVDSLYGADSILTSSTDDTVRLMKRCTETARARGITNVVCATCGEYFPKSARIWDDAFRETVPDDVSCEILPSGTVAERIVSKPGGSTLIIGEVPAIAPIRGVACGLIGAAGLMPDTLMGDGLSVYCPALDASEQRRNNPTSVYLSAANLLIDNGFTIKGSRLVEAVREMYAQKIVDRDMSGKRTAAGFMDGVESLLFPGTGDDCERPRQPLDIESSFFRTINMDGDHHSAIEAALRFEDYDRVPVNNFALVTAARSAGIKVKDARYDPKVSAKVSVDYSLKTLSDFVKPVVDSQMVFADMGMKVDFPDDDYGAVKSTLVSSEDNLDDLAFFDSKRASECPHFTKCIIDSLKETSKILPEDLAVCGLSWGPISTAGYLMGTENLIFSMMMGDGLAEKTIERCAGFVSDQQLAMADAGATVMWVADPTSSGDLLSPDMYPVPVKALKEVTGTYKKNCEGFSFIHICGDTSRLIPLVAETGADCMSFDHAVDPAKAYEAAAGKIALMGNIDPIEYIMQGDPDGIRAECRSIIDRCGAGRGFILAPGCETPISSPDANVRAMGEVGRDYFSSSAD